METKYGFKKMNLSEFGDWLGGLRVSRTILRIQQHHTYSPNYIHFTGNNHFERQKAMRDYHIQTNGWKAIGQHLTIFPDGIILTGRDMADSPACIFGQNANAVCIENFGNFDIGKDVMRAQQKEAIIRSTALLCSKFNIPVSADFMVYHHWFDLISGMRNNGTRNNKSCPGSGFFGGNKVADCEREFLPLIAEAISGTIKTELTDVIRYVITTAQSLNVRTGPTVLSSRVADSPTVSVGSILRVYAQQGDWLKISKTGERWVSARYTAAVQRAAITADKLRMRRGPGTDYPISGSLSRGEIVFVSEYKNGWYRLGQDQTWVSGTYLQIQPNTENPDDARSISFIN